MKKGVKKRAVKFGLLLFLFLIFFMFIINSENSESSSEWWMYMKYLNHTGWDGNTYTVIGGLNNVSYNITSFLSGYTIQGSPIVANGYVYIGHQYQRMFQLNASNISQGINSYVASLCSVFSAAAYWNGYLYFGCYFSNVTYQLNASNLQLVASIPLAGATWSSSPAISNGYLYIGAGKYVHQLNASNVAQQITNFSTQGASNSIYYSSPAIANGYVYIGGTQGDNRLYQLNASNISQQIANFTTNGDIYSAPAVYNGYVYVGAGTFYQLNASNISIQVNNFSAATNRNSPAIDNGYVYVGSSSNTFYQLNASNISQQINSFNPGSASSFTYNSPSVAYGYVYIGNGNNRTYQLNASNISQQITNFTTNGSIYSTPAVANGYIYFASTNNYVYQLNATNINQPNLKICYSCSDCTTQIINANSRDTIFLGSSISNINQDCIPFNGKSNITLDCQGNSLSSAGGFYGIFLNATNGSNNNTIKNCNASNFTYGIYLSSSSNNTLTNITANNNIQYGIVLGGSNNNILTTITTNNNLYSGIALSGGSNNSILTTITANNNSQSGIYLLQSSNNNTLIDIITNYNRLYGISLLTSRNNTLTNITANNNGRGIFLSSSNNTILTNITANYNNFSGVHFYSSSYYNILKDSHVENNTYYGLYFVNQSEKYPEYNLVYNNYFNNTVNYYNSTNLTNYFNTTKTLGTNIVNGSYIGGNFWGYPNNTGFSQLNSTCTDADSDGICDSSYDLDGLNFDYLPLMLLASSTSGNTNGTNGTTDGTTGGSTGSGTSITNQTITPTNPAEILINNSKLDLIKLIVEVLEAVSGVSFSVKEVNIPNINEEIGISGILYQAFNITAKNITNDKIKNITIEFKVNKTWLSKNNGTSSDIRLHRKQNLSSRWETLLTNLEDDDNDYYYYSSISPGFSTFVIFYGKYECQPGTSRCFEEQSQLCLGNSTWLITEKCRFGCENGKCIKTAPQSIIVYTLVIAIVSVAIILTSYLILAKVLKKKRR